MLAVVHSPLSAAHLRQLRRSIVQELLTFALPRKRESVDRDSPDGRRIGRNFYPSFGREAVALADRSRCGFAGKGF